MADDHNENDDGYCDCRYCLLSRKVDAALATEDDPEVRADVLGTGLAVMLDCSNNPIETFLAFAQGLGRTLHELGFDVTAAEQVLQGVNNRIGFNIPPRSKMN